MTGEVPVREKRREPRFQVVRPCSKVINIQCHVHVHDETIGGELIDLSRSGAKVLLPRCVKISEIVEVRIVIPEINATMDVSAAVCFVRPAENNHWCVGCAFASEISDDVIDMLATSGVIQRRRGCRYPIIVKGNARWELEMETFPVRIGNCSTQGFCMYSQRPGNVGAAFLLEFEATSSDAFSVHGRVCWQLERDGEYLLGCLLTSNRSTKYLRMLSRMLDNSFVGTPHRRLERVMFIAATWFFIFLGGILAAMQFA